MKSVGIRTVVSAIFVTLPMAALADWQYTRWGMSVGDVAKATNGLAATNSDRKLDSAELKTLLVTPYKSGSFQFSVQFMFDANERLQAVGLSLLNLGACSMLLGELSNIYGDGKVSRGRVTVSAKWWDQKNLNVIDYLMIGNSLIGTSACVVHYSELKERGRAGGL